MHVKSEVTHLFEEINQNLNNLEPTKIALENAIRKPIHRVFKAVPQEHYRKLYSEISRITHPDKMNQALSGAVSDDPVVLFYSKIYALAQTLDSSERDAFLRTPQQLIETYQKDLDDHWVISVTHDRPSRK